MLRRMVTVLKTILVVPGTKPAPELDGFSLYGAWCLRSLHEFIRSSLGLTFTPEVLNNTEICLSRNVTWNIGGYQHTALHMGITGGTSTTHDL